MGDYGSSTTTMRCAMRNSTFSVNLTVCLLGLGLPGLVMGQTQSDSNARTSWGDPNLQGTWSYASLTPLQRPTSLGEREYYSEEEAAERNIAVTRDVAPPPGSVGSYNALWFDRGSVRASSDGLKGPLARDRAEVLKVILADWRQFDIDTVVQIKIFFRCV